MLMRSLAAIACLIQVFTVSCNEQCLAGSISDCRCADNSDGYQVCTEGSWGACFCGDPVVWVAPDADADSDVDADRDVDADADIDGCVPECSERECGDDGCGGECEPGCEPGETCDDLRGSCVSQEVGSFSVSCYNGAASGWYTSNIVWHPGGSGTADVPGDEEWLAVEAAFDAWSDVECSTLSFTRGEAVAEPSDLPSDSSIVVFFESDEEALGTHRWIIGYGAGYSIYKATIALNDRDYDWVTDGGSSGTRDIQTAMMSALGFALGLDFPPEGSDTVLDGPSPARELGADDILAIQYLYPDAACDSPPAPERLCCEESRTPGACDACVAIGSVECAP